MRGKRMKLDKTTLIAQGFFVVWLSSFLSSKNIYSPKPNCLPRDRKVGVVCVRAAHKCALIDTENTENTLLARPKTTQQIVSPLTKKVWFLIVNQGRFTACGFKRLETEAFLRESAARWADSRNVIRIIQLNKAIGERKEKKKIPKQQHC